MRQAFTDYVLSLAIGTVFVLGMVVLWAMAQAKAAPAPATPKPKPVVARTVERLQFADLAGQWTMDWCNGKWDTKLRPDGTYACVSGSSIWVGNWWIDFEGRLAVTEALLDENGLPGAPSSWAVKWAKDKRGRLDPASLSGKLVREDGDEFGDFGLVPVKKARRP